MSDGYEPVRRALNFIETRLSEPIGLAEIAREACLSPWHFHRLFAGAVGEPPVAYLRRRRLSEAAKHLQSGQRSVLDVGLGCGFESQAAFTRAFRNQYGIPPGQFRKGAPLIATLAYEPFDPKNLRPRGEIMEPRMVEKPAFTLMGLAREFTPETMKGIAKLWETFAPQIGALPGKRGWTCYGLCIPGEKTDGDEASFTYACSMEVAPGTEPPEGLTRFDVPAARYAVFTFDDHISRIGSFVEKVFGEWLPAAGLTRTNSPDFELYDQSWNPETGTGKIDYYVPVELL